MLFRSSELLGRAEAGLLASETHAFIDDKGETDMAEFDFNESHHGCLVGFFYDELKKAFSKRSIAAFKKAAQIYGEQRGGRMALRALRDGQDLSYNSYFHYREWPLTQDFFK